MQSDDLIIFKILQSDLDNILEPLKPHSYFSLLPHIQQVAYITIQSHLCGIYVRFTCVKLNKLDEET